MGRHNETPLKQRRRRFLLSKRGTVSEDQYLKEVAEFERLYGEPIVKGTRPHDAKKACQAPGFPRIAHGDKDKLEWVPCRLQCGSCGAQWSEPVHLDSDPTCQRCACGATRTRAWDLRDNGEIGQNWRPLAGSNGK